MYNTCFVLVATDCFDRYTWCHLVPQHKVCDHEFYGTHCCLSCKGQRWCWIWCSTTTTQIFTVIRKPLCVPLPLHSHSEVQWRTPAEICPSLLFSTTWQAVRDTASFIVCFLLILVIHNVPNTILTLFSRKAMNANFWYCRRCVHAVGSWSMNSEREMVKLLQHGTPYKPYLDSVFVCNKPSYSWAWCYHSMNVNLTLYVKTSPSMCLTVIPNVYVFNYIQIYRVYFS